MSQLQITPKRRMADTRTVHCRRERCDVFIGRPSKWGNPFHEGVDGDRHEVIKKYREWIVTQPHLMDALQELKGKKLGCFCDPLPCHGDVLVELVRELEDKNNDH